MPHVLINFTLGYLSFSQTEMIFNPERRSYNIATKRSYDIPKRMSYGLFLFLMYLLSEVIDTILFKTYGHYYHRKGMAVTLLFILAYVTSRLDPKTYLTTTYFTEFC